jgi:hypothetical protein
MAGDRVSLRDYIEAQLGNIDRRLNESAHDRERIRTALGERVSRSELDQVLARLGAVERTLARLAGALAVVVLLASILGVVLRYLVG